MHQINLLSRLLLISSLLTFSLTGCKLAYRGLLGIDTTPSYKTERSLLIDAKRRKIPQAFNLIADTANFHNDKALLYKEMFAEMKKDSTVDSLSVLKIKKVYKDDSQPVQFRLFKNTGEEIFKLVNCYVDPPIPMDWNVNNCFDQFPPQIDIESLNTHYINLDFFLAHASKPNGEKLKIQDLPKTDYFGIIIWNDYFIKPSRKLINTVKESVKNESITLIYINNHNANLWYLIDGKTKEAVKSELSKKNKE